jgi:hypothetical protein
MLLALWLFDIGMCGVTLPILNECCEREYGCENVHIVFLRNNGNVVGSNCEVDWYAQSKVGARITSVASILAIVFGPIVIFSSIAIVFCSGFTHIPPLTAHDRRHYRVSRRTSSTLLCRKFLWLVLMCAIGIGAFFSFLLPSILDTLKNSKCGASDLSQYDSHSLLPGAGSGPDIMDATSVRASTTFCEGQFHERLERHVCNANGMYSAAIFAVIGLVVSQLAWCIYVAVRRRRERKRIAEHYASVHEPNPHLHGVVNGNEAVQPQVELAQL